MSDSTRPPATHQPGSRPLIPPKPVSYDYHWGRILGVVLLLTILGLGFYGYRHWHSSPAEEESLAEVSTQAEPSVSVQSELPTSIPEPFSRDEADTPAENTEVSEPSPVTDRGEVKPLWEEAMVSDELPPSLDGEQAPARPVEPSDATDIEGAVTEEIAPPEEELEKPVYFIDEEITSESDAEVEAQSIPESVDPVVVETRSIEESSSVEPVAEPEMIEAGVEPQAESGRFVLRDLQIKAEGVKRFQLARTVRNREPVGELSEIDFNSDDNTSVWAFSEVMSMRGERLNYVWFYQGGEIARVRIRVGADRWRSYSSKTVNRGMSGAWRVELQDGQGRPLASADFLVL